MANPESKPTIIKIKYEDIIKHQAVLNIGTAGHVSHGKSTLVRQLTGVRTQKHKKERVSDKTINLGYANAKVWIHSETGQINTTSSDGSKDPPWVLLCHMSFVDTPGHHAYMSTMIGGSQIMNGAALVVSGHDPIPQPQTVEHLVALRCAHVTKLIVLHNKLDLIDHPAAKKSYRDLTAFIKKTLDKTARIPIIPISAQTGANIPLVAEIITASFVSQMIKDPTLNVNGPGRLVVVRSFDINHNVKDINDLKGGVIGGTVTQGIFRIGDTIEIRPGIITRSGVVPLFAKIQTIKSETHNLEYAIPGGLIAFGLSIDPSLTRSNRLVGRLAGHVGSLPDIHSELTLYTKRIRLKEKGHGSFKPKEQLVVNVNALTVRGSVKEFIPVNDHSCAGHGIRNKRAIAGESSADGRRSGGSCKGVLVLTLETPVCITLEQRIAIMRKSKHSADWRLCCSGTFMTKKAGIKTLPPLDIVPPQTTFPEVDIEMPHDFDKLLELLTSRIPVYADMLESISTTVPGQKIEIPCPRSTTVRKNTYFSNFIAFCDRLKTGIAAAEKISTVPVSVDTECRIDLTVHMEKFICEELSTCASVKEDGQMRIKGRFGNTRIQSLIMAYIRKFVCCDQCSGRSLLYRDSDRKITKVCLYCGSKSH